uniref:Uncharacterized protein n=1 Tax=Junco hyemalis TaxID=40217 RepID=A0A8C5NKB3_JUNHY
MSGCPRNLGVPPQLSGCPRVPHSSRGAPNLRVPLQSRGAPNLGAPPFWGCSPHFGGAPILGVPSPLRQRLSSASSRARLSLSALFFSFSFSNFFFHCSAVSSRFTEAVFLMVLALPNLPAW